MVELIGQIYANLQAIDSQVSTSGKAVDADTAAWSKTFGLPGAAEKAAAEEQTDEFDALLDMLRKCDESVQSIGKAVGLNYLEDSVGNDTKAWQKTFALPNAGGEASRKTDVADTEAWAKSFGLPTGSD